MTEAKSDSLISREIIFGNPDKIVVRISPNGENLSFIAPFHGVLNIFLAKNHQLEEAEAITFDSHRGIRCYSWTYDSSSIIYKQDKDGDENNHLYKIDLTSRKIVDLTPFPGAKAEIFAMSREIPDFVIVGINERRKDLFDLYLVNLKNNKTILLYKNDLYSSLSFDDQYNLRFGSVPQADGGAITYQFKKSSAIQDLISLLKAKPDASETDYVKFLEDLQANEAQLFMNIAPEDIYTTDIATFGKDYNSLYLLDSRGRDKSALVIKNLAHNEEKVLFANDKADVESIIQNPITKEIEAVSWNYTKSKWHFFDARLEKVFAALERQAERPGNIDIISRTLDDKIWIIAILSDLKATSYYRVNLQKDEANPEITYLFSGDSQLDKLELAPMHPVIIKSEDGLDLVSYLTLPKKINYSIKVENDLLKEVKAPHPVPLILNVHGGPTARDDWGLDKEHQWLADRGYAVLSVNYRGSTGFGKSFIMQGDGEWSKKMHQDLIDAANWAVKAGITSQDTIGIFGGSYGGYAALVGLTFTPDFFKCGVDIVGPSNLQSLLATIPDYWKPALEALNKKITGKVNPSEEDLTDRSPITFVNKISKPLLIGHGAQDPRVKQSESDQIVEVMKSKNIPVIYALYPDEGHGFARPENRKSFYFLSELFLHQHLGGQLEAYNHDFDKSALEIKSGLELLPEEISEELN